MGNVIVDTSATPVLVYPGVTDSQWLDFWQGIVASLAWPLVVILLIVLFHRQILAKLPDLDVFKVAGAEMSFKKRVEAVVDQAKEIDTPETQDAEANNERLAHLVNLAAASPTGAILAAWKDLEATANEVLELAAHIMPYESSGGTDNVHQDIKWSNQMTKKMNSATALYNFKLLPRAEVKTYEELRLLKNRATHEPDGTISTEEARSYVGVADKLTDLLRGMKRALNAEAYPGSY